MAKNSRVLTMASFESDAFQVGRGDLSYWEFVNNSDAEYSDDCFSVDSLPDDVVSWGSMSSSSSSPPRIDEISIVHQDLDTHDDRDRLSADQEQFGGGNRSDIVDESPKEPAIDGGSIACDIGGIREPPACNGGYVYNPYGTCGYGYDDQEENSDEVVEADEDDDDDDNELDDELVPRWVGGKLGRQRMRKLSKRAYSKISSSKRFPYSHVKPGCLYGKHGYGLKYRS